MTDFRRAGPEHAAAILPMMRAYYAEDGYAFDDERSRAALLGLLADERLGEVWLAMEADRAVGYVVLCLGWSLEYRGRDAFIDEIFVAPDARRRGLGRRLMELAVDRCRALEVRALHLEVEGVNAKAHALYRSLGFKDNDRRLMSKRL